MAGTNILIDVIRGVMLNGSDVIRGILYNVKWNVLYNDKNKIPALGKYVEIMAFLIFAEMFKIDKILRRHNCLSF